MAAVRHNRRKEGKEIPHGGEGVMRGEPSHRGGAEGPQTAGSGRNVTIKIIASVSPGFLVEGGISRKIREGGVAAHKGPHIKMLPPRDRANASRLAPTGGGGGITGVGAIGPSGGISISGCEG